MSGDFLRLHDVGLVYTDGPAPSEALKHINLTLAAGERLTILGPSGCGKSSLLKVIAGLERATSGDITLDGKAVTAPRPDVAIVFQDYGLFPWKTVEENMTLPRTLAHKAVGKDEIDAVLSTLGLTDVRRQFPGQLSGGQKQRTALGRVMLSAPRLVLLDEPFSALDPAMREQCYDLLDQYLDEADTALIMVTHSVEEARRFGSRTVVFDDEGRSLARVVENEKSH